MLREGGLVWKLRWYSEFERVLLNVRLYHARSKQFDTPYFIVVDRYFSEARKRQVNRVTRQH